MASDETQERRASKRRTMEKASHAWQSLVQQPRATKTACTALVPLPTVVVGSANPANTELGRLAHAALSLQAAFANRAVSLPGDLQSKVVHSKKQVEGRHDREKNTRRMQAKRKCASTSAQSSQSSVLPTLAHGQALAQALGSPIDSLSTVQQQRTCQAVFEDCTASSMLTLTSPLSDDDGLPCHRCGVTIKLEQEESMTCVHCDGEPIHRNCLPPGERKHECQWCMPTSKQSVEADNAPKPPMSLGTLLAIL